MAIRTWAAAILVVGALAGCGGTDGELSASPTSPPAAGAGALGDAPPAASSTTPRNGSSSGLPRAPGSTSGPTEPSSAAAADAGLTCDRLRNSQLNSAGASELGYPQRIQLTNGAWSGGGLTVSLRECAIGDLDGDSGADGLASVVFTNGGTGQFSYLAYWRNTAGEPVYTTAAELGDRTPVERLSIAGRKATVVMLTRTPDMPAAAVNIRRTSVYVVSSSTLVEQSHADTPYAP